MTWEDISADFDDDLPANFQTTVITPSTKAAHLAFFYRQIKAKIISKCIEGSLEEASFKNLLVKKKEFTWPGTIVGIQ